VSIIEDDENSGDREREQFMYLALEVPSSPLNLSVVCPLLRFSNHTLSALHGIAQAVTVRYFLRSATGWSVFGGLRATVSDEEVTICI